MKNIAPFILIIVSQMLINFFINEHIKLFNLKKNENRIGFFDFKVFRFLFCPFFYVFLKKSLKKLKIVFVCNTFYITII